ncbi:hypothetical protein ACTA71_010406 [Dictyostelium dimigraforme]
MGYDYRLNIVLVGDNQCGKSCLMGRYSDGIFMEDGQIWLGIELKSKGIELKMKNKGDMVNVKLMISDGNGGYRFKEIFYDGYFKNQHGFIIIYDVTNLESFNNLSNWISKIKNSYQTSDLYPSPEPIIFIVGNKNDLKDSIVVDSKKAQEFCDSLSIPSIHNCSVKENLNVEIIFQRLSQLIMDTYPPPPISKINNNGINKCLIN